MQKPAAATGPNDSDPRCVYADFVERLIAYGHPPESVWDYSPAQAEAFLWLAERRRRRERAEMLSVNALAHRGDMKDINARVRKDWAGR